MSKEVAESASRAKTRWTDQIGQSLECGDFTKAKSLTQQALAEFPNDPDLLALEEQSIQGRERSAQAHQIMEEAQQLCAERNFAEGLQVLRNAFALEKRNPIIRAALVDNLLSHARSLLESDLFTAEALAQEAVDLDPVNALAQGLSRIIADRKRLPRTAPSATARPDQRLANSQPPQARQPQMVPPSNGEPPSKTVVDSSNAPGIQTPVMSTVPVNGSPSHPLAPSVAETRPSPTKTTPPETPAKETLPKVASPIPQAPAKAAEPSVTKPVAANPANPVQPPKAAVPGKSANPAVAVAVATAPNPVVLERNAQVQPQASQAAAKTLQPPAPANARPVQPQPAPQVQPQGAATDGATERRAAPVKPQTPAVRPVAQIPTTNIQEPVAKAAEPSTSQAPLQPENHSQSSALLEEQAPPARPAAPVRPSARSRKPPIPVWIWIVAVLVVLVVCGVLVRNALHQIYPTVVPVLVEIRTSPPEAKVRINGEFRDITRPLQLSPGNYHIEALLDGHDRAAQDVNITQEFRGPIELILPPMAQGLRLFTDLESGSVLLDDRPVGELEEGHFSIDSVKPGKHTLRVTNGRSAQAVIPFEMTTADPPVITGPISTRELSAIVVSNYQSRGHVYSNFGPVSLRIDGEPVGEVPRTGGLDLANLSAMSHDLIFGEGKDQLKISVDVSPAAGLFVSLSADRDIGTLEIMSNEDGFHVLVNGKPHKVTKQKGHYYVYNLDAKTSSVQIAKSGFQSDPPERRTAVRKGETTSVSFKLTPVPTTATLHIRGVLPGTRVSLDGASYDVQPDGSLNASLSEGEHTLEFRKPGYKTKALRLSAKAGQTVNLSGSDVIVDSVATGKVVITRNPADAKVILRRHDGTELSVSGREAEAPEGDYTVFATAPGYREQSKPVRISEGTTASVDIKLAAIPQTTHMERWEDSGAWKSEGGWFSRKGGNFVLYRASSSTGTFQFTARHGGRQLPLFSRARLQWVVNYLDSQNYELYQIDKDKLYWKRFVDGKSSAEKQGTHGIKILDDSYQLLIEVGSGQVVQKIRDGQSWKALPRLGEDGPTVKEGRFGFLLPGNDEIRLTNFEFVPKDQNP